MLFYQDYIVAPYVAWADLKKEILLPQLAKWQDSRYAPSKSAFYWTDIIRPTAQLDLSSEHTKLFSGYNWSDYY